MKRKWDSTRTITRKRTDVARWRGSSRRMRRKWRTGEEGVDESILFDIFF